MRPTSLQRGDIFPPVVFVSSTFEDQNRLIRDALKDDLEKYDYLPMMSELGSFS